MPERPDLEVVVPALAEGLVGRRIAGVDVHMPTVVRVALRGTPAELLAGRTITAVARRGHFVVWSTDGDVEVAIHPMLAGAFRFVDRPKSAHVAVAFALEGGGWLHYADSKQMGKVWVLSPSQRSQAPGLEHVGIDVLDPAVFTWEAFAAIARARRDQLKTFLLDKATLDSFGNAYADEVCFEAGIHPKAWVKDLDEATLRRLHAAMPAVLGAARDEVRRRGAPIDEKVRDFLKVRNRKGEPCPRCGAPIRVAGVNGYDAFFCAVCQPDGRGSTLVDWRKAATGSKLGD
jgi:formamidopyrimidine-DNA glycosylase